MILLAKHLTKPASQTIQVCLSGMGYQGFKEAHYAKLY
jgi:phosphoribosylformylglycinamidine (FGAM) synthase PurS component